MNIPDHKLPPSVSPLKVDFKDQTYDSLGKNFTESRLGANKENIFVTSNVAVVSSGGSVLSLGGGQAHLRGTLMGGHSHTRDLIQAKV